MGIEELVERTTITFPIGISERELTKLMKYLVTNLNAVLHLNTAHSINIGEYCSDSTEISISNIRVAGSISQKNNASHASFICKQRYSEDENNLFHEIIFQTIPGYDLREHNSGEIEIWGKTKELIQKYFSERES